MGERKQRNKIVLIKEEYSLEKKRCGFVIKIHLISSSGNHSHQESIVMLEQSKGSNYKKAQSSPPSQELDELCQGHLKRL